MRIFNAPQDRAQSIVSQHNIENIISVYSPNKTFPLFPGVKSDQILRLCFNDISRPQNNLKIITTEKDYFKINENFQKEMLYLKLKLKIFNEKKFLEFLTHKK